MNEHVHTWDTKWKESPFMPTNSTIKGILFPTYKDMGLSPT